MQKHKGNLLLVDDDISIRKLLSVILTLAGYEVRSAQDGFSALAAIREQCPNVILSDLNMPRMSGFEFLSVIRRRCPGVLVVAMSSLFSGDGVPTGVAADGFYEKGTNVGDLLHLISAVMERGRQLLSTHSTTIAPIWIPSNGHDPAGDPYVMIACPECQRIFKQVRDNSGNVIHETGCVHCKSPIHYAIA